MKGASHPIVDPLSPASGLEEDEGSSADNGDEVEGQVQKVPYHSFDAERAKGTLESPTKPRDRIPSRAKLPPMFDELALVLGEERAVKGVEEGILQEVGPGDHADNGGALVKDEKTGSEDGERPVDED